MSMLFAIMVSSAGVTVPPRLMMFAACPLALMAVSPAVLNV
ncbi:MAG: hypothetical protein ACR5LC_09730 [Symbiopectobacterium sp.]